MLVAILWVIASLFVAELLGYFLHRLLHSDKIRFLSRSHMTHHLLLYGPLQQQRPGPLYFDATTGKIALGNIGLEWLAPAGLLLALSLGAFRLFHVRAIHQLIFVTITLTWSFLMFSYLHDRMHIQGCWLARNRFSKHWFRKARRLHDIHHVSLNGAGLMNKNFGIGFFFFDRIFGTFSSSSRPFNRQGYEAAQKRYAFLRDAITNLFASEQSVTRVQWGLLGGGLMKQIGRMLLLIATLALSLAAQKSVEHVKTYTPDAIHWGAAPNALPSGAQLTVLEGDPTKPGSYTMRLKMSDGYKIPPHHHLRREHVTVISGAFKVGMGDSFDEGKMNEFTPGSFAYLEPAVHHYAMAKGETVIQLHGTGPWEIKYVNPSDDPRGAAGSGKTKKQ